MKKIIKIISLLFAMLLFFAGTVTQVKADVVFEPINSDFYSKHISECHSVERSYLVNGPDGKVTIYASPEDNHVEGTLDNGSHIFVNYIYTGGDVEWGYVEDWSQQAFGWVPMPYLQEQYDAHAFNTQHREQIINEIWDLDDKFCDVEIYVYSYPGAENAFTLIVPSEDNCLSGSTQYTDEFGNQWGHFDYFYAQNGWICLNNATATYEELYPKGGPEYKLDSEDSDIEDEPQPEVNTKPAEPEKPIVPRNAHPNVVDLVIIGTLVAAVVVATIIILILLGKKKNK